ncbi:MAG: PAS domain-containing protein [Hyphomicrobiaceae bacterium]
MLPTRLKNCRVLYVEDEPLIAMDGEATLRDLGFENIVMALTYADARSRISEQTFDLALMDINLGGGQTSLPLAKMLAAQGSRVILASGYSSTGEHVGSQLGLRIEKPFDEEVLLRAVLRVMEPDSHPEEDSLQAVRRPAVSSGQSSKVIRGDLTSDVSLGAASFSGSGWQFGRQSPSLPLLTWLVLMSAALIVPTMLVSGVALMSLARTEMAASRDHVAQAARDLTADIDREVNGLLTVLETLATSQSLASGDLRSFHSRASAALGPRRAYVLLLDTSFQQLLNTRVPFGTSLPRTSDPQSAAHVLATGKAHVSDSFRGAVSELDVVNLLMPVRKGGAVVYILVITINTERIAGILRGFSVPAGWQASVSDGAGRVMAMAGGGGSPPGPTGQIGRSVDAAANVVARQKSELTGWTTSVWAPARVVDAPLWRGLGWLALAGGLASLLAAIFVGWLNRRLARSIDEIQRSTEDLAAGLPTSAKHLPISEAASIMKGLQRASELIQARTESLRESEARYRAGLRAGRIGSWETDFSRGTRQWSKEAESLFGLNLVDGKGVVGGAHDELLNAMHPEDRHLLAEYHNRIACNDDLDAEYRIVLPDGTIRHVAGRGEVVSRQPDGSPASW